MRYIRGYSFFHCLRWCQRSKRSDVGLPVDSEQPVATNLRDWPKCWVWDECDGTLEADKAIVLAKQVPQPEK